MKVQEAKNGWNNSLVKGIHIKIKGVIKMNKKLFLIFVFGTFLASAQVKNEDKEKELATKLELFLAEKGKLIVREYYELGRVRSGSGSTVELNAIVIYEPGQEDEKVRGLRIGVTEGGTNARTRISFLDLEEIEGLSKAIDYMISLSKKWKDVQKEYIEVEFSTQGDFRIGFYQKGIKQKAFSSSGLIGRVSAYLSTMEKLSSIKVMADKGLNLLSEK